MGNFCHKESGYYTLNVKILLCRFDIKNMKWVVSAECITDYDKNLKRVLSFNQFVLLEFLEFVKKCKLNDLVLVEKYLCK